MWNSLSQGVLYLYALSIALVILSFTYSNLSNIEPLGNLIGYVVPTDSSILDLSEYTTNYSEGILTLTGTVTNQILNI